MDKKNRPFRPVPFFIHIFLISEYQLIFFSIRRCRINHEFLCPKIRIQLRRISIALSHNDESAVLTVLHFKAVIKSGEGIPEFHQLYQLLYHGPVSYTHLDVYKRQIQYQAKRQEEKQKWDTAENHILIRPS